MHNISFSSSSWVMVIILIVSGFASYFSGKLTAVASVAGVFIAIIIYIGAGIPAVIMLAVFFSLGSLATSYKKEYKQEMNVAEVGESKRKLGQVLANAGVPALFALANIANGYTQPIFLVMIAGSFASALGDTFSSEFGNVHGKNFYNILTLKKDQRGLNGVVSIEGTLFGVLGSFIVGIIHSIAYDWDIALLMITISGIVGNLSDSLLGALFERKGILGNDAVNFLNTAIGSGVAFLCMRLVIN